MKKKKNHNCFDIQRHTAATMTFNEEKKKAMAAVKYYHKCNEIGSWFSFHLARSGFDFVSGHQQRLRNIKLGGISMTLFTLYIHFDCGLTHFNWTDARISKKAIKQNFFYQSLAFPSACTVGCFRKIEDGKIVLMNKSKKCYCVCDCNATVMSCMLLPLSLSRFYRLSFYNTNWTSNNSDRREVHESFELLSISHQRTDRIKVHYFPDRWI